MLATMDGMHAAADRVKLMVQQQMNDLRKAIDAKEQVRYQGCAFVCAQVVVMHADDGR